MNRLPNRSGVLTVAPAVLKLAGLPPGTPRDMRNLSGTTETLSIEPDTGVVDG